MFEHGGFESSIDLKMQHKWTLLLDRLLDRATLECVFKLEDEGSDSDEIKSYISELEMRSI